MKTSFKEPPGKGYELVFIKPLILGGSPTEDNMRYVSRTDHIKLVRYWNGILRELQDRAKGTR